MEYSLGIFTFSSSLCILALNRPKSLTCYGISFAMTLIGGKVEDGQHKELPYSVFADDTK